MGMRLSNGSKTPVFSSPACSTTMTGAPETAASACSSAAGARRPCSSVSSPIRLSEPRPSRRTARLTLPWRSRLVKMRIVGAPARPRSSTIPSGAFEHGVARGGEARDVGHLASGDEGEAGALRDAEQLLQAMRPRSLPRARRRDRWRRCPAFWSQAEVSQSAASAAGTTPPITQA